MSIASTPALAAAEELPDLGTFAERVAAGASRLKSVRELHAWLASLDPLAPLEIRCERLEVLARWLRASGPIPPRAGFDASDSTDQADPTSTRRLRLLLQAFEIAPACTARFRKLVANLLGESHGIDLFEAGLPNQRGVWAESSDRLSRRFLPSVRSPRDLLELVARMFPGRNDADWLQSLPADLVAALAGVLDLLPLRAALIDALHLAAGKVSSLGLTRDLRLRSSEGPLTDSPFFQLPRACDALSADPGEDARVVVERLIGACRREVGVVLGHLEEFGVSVDVVYRLEVIGKSLDRLEPLAELVVTPDSEAARALLVTLLRAQKRDRSLRDLAGSNARLIARKVIERAGSSGEHYITRTRAEYWGMLASAGGGGLLTTATAALKYMVASGHFPLFVEGLMASTNYAISFLLMQLFGLTLATKQPSMTAAALAGALRDGHGAKEDELEPLVTVVARICRSQLAAAFGNVGLVIPGALAFDWYFRHRTGHSFLNDHEAQHTLESLHPLHSGTIFFAALTGVILWASSLCAGWLENWSTYRRLPDAIAQHRLGLLVGRGTMRWIAAQLRHGISGIGGNVSIGVLLGMVPVFGKFLGVPLEVRHLTLSTGSLALSVSSLGLDAFSGSAFAAILFAILGIVIIGALNFGVSFGLALSIALRAREVPHGGWRLTKAVLRRFYYAPIQFLFPPSDPNVA
jgi:site-specific recombinase